MPRPPQVGHAVSTFATGDASRRRPSIVYCTGRSSATSPCLRSSLHTAATIGTGKSAALARARTDTGSSRASADVTASTPRTPSASPTALATSSTTTSGNGAGDAGDGCTLDAEARPNLGEHVVAANTAVREKVDIGERELRPRMDAQV